MDKKGNINAALILFGVFIATALLSMDLGEKSLWVDEIFSVNAVRHFNNSFGDFFSFIAGDVHPPLYFLLLSLWAKLSGDSDISIRFFSVLCALLVIAANYFFTKKILTRSTAILSSFIIGISPFFLLYSRMARYYVLEALLVCVCNILFLKIMEGKRTLPVTMSYIVFSAAVPWCFYPAALLIVSHTACFFILKRYHNIPAKYWIITQSIIALCILPALLLSMNQTSRFSNDINADLSASPLGTIAAAGDMLYEFSCGGTIFPWGISALLLLAITSIFTARGLFFLWKEEKKIFLLLITLFLIPAAGMLIIFNTIASNHSFILFASRCFFLFPVFTVILAKGFYSFPGFKKLIIPIFVILNFFPIKSYFSGDSFLNPIYAIPSREIAHEIAANYSQNDLVIAPADSAVPEYLERLARRPETYEYDNRMNAISAIKEKRPEFVIIVSLGRDRMQKLYEDDPEEAVTQIGYSFEKQINYLKSDKTFLALKEFLFKKKSYQYKVTTKVFKKIPFLTGRETIENPSHI
ncbi:MAG: glycosyltransferase family 39 protein [Candidatus Schekmanbacteria bacterium]|nr:glycosyltransferase family 39 protein [Candidatus Schekmanbacteria bacterium]